MSKRKGTAVPSDTALRVAWWALRLSWNLTKFSFLTTWRFLNWFYDATRIEPEKPARKKPYDKYKDW